MVKLIISGLGFYFHIYNFFPLLKPKVFFYFRTFCKSRFFFKTPGLLEKKNSYVFINQVFFFANSRFFLKTKFFIVLNNAHVIYLATTIAGSKKMNKMALMIKMVFICFMLHVPLDSNY